MDTEKMEEIRVGGRVLQFKQTVRNDFTRTEFFEGTEQVSRKKYYLFGPVITSVVPKFVFSLPYDIKDPENSKAAVRRGIEAYVMQLDRAEEIKRGEII